MSKQAAPQKYQPRFVAYAKHLGKTPDEVAAVNNWTADYMAWITIQLKAWGKATGRDCRLMSEADHDNFTAFLANAAEQQREAA